jgi:hypothetical protein
VGKKQGNEESDASAEEDQAREGKDQIVLPDRYIEKEQSADHKEDPPRCM